MEKLQKPYPHMFAPLTVRGKVFRNRIISSPNNGAPNLVRPGADGFNNFTETAIRYYGAIARGGAAVVNTGHLGVDPEYYLGTDNDRFDFFTNDVTRTPTLNALTDMIHAYGALASIELNHGGHLCQPVKRDYLLGPCDTVSPEGTVHAMDEAEMERVADCFANAALVGKRCGFDIVNVHGGHNWLLGAFFSPISNKRTDKYGGDWKNRARFPRMVLERIREKVGSKMIIEMRFSASEYSEGGITLDEAAATIDYLSDVVDIVQCTGGRVDDPYSEGFSMSLPYMNHACNAWLATEMRKRMKSQTILETVGAINEPSLAEEILTEGSADLVAMARSFIADPNWVIKAEAGTPEDIRPCIRCLRCLATSTEDHCNRSKCTVNPRRILPVELAPSEIPFRRKKVVVIGGGAAGMQAAHELSLKGHEVILMEKESKLGGVLFFTDHVVFKDDLRRYREYLAMQVMKDSNITVMLDTEATPERVAAMQADAIIVAAGATPFIPPVPGANKKNVIHAVQMFGNEDKLGNKIVLVGGGFVGCEATVHLQSMGKQVSVIEMNDRLMPEEPLIVGECFYTQYYMKHEFSRDHVPSATEPEIDRVKIYLGAQCGKIEDNGVWIKSKELGELFLEADTIVMATGFRPRTAFAEQFEGLAKQVLAVGDCRKVGNITSTSEDGYYAALRI